MTRYEKNFSTNVRKYRKELGLTQKTLAETIGYSEKTVSKWETDGCIPSIDALMKIASIFHIDLNTLFSDHETVYYLGIDGGGTKTAFALADSTGKIIRQLRLGPCNPFDVGIETTKTVLRAGIRQICQDISPAQIFTFAGIAGAVSGNYGESLREFIQEFHFAGAEIGSDNENIIAAGLGERDGITIILGTGICCYVVQNDLHHKISGWGYLFDEGGSGFNIARDAFSQYFASCDGSGLPTSLVVAIEERSGCDPCTLMTELYEGGKKVIASYADVVFKEAEKGDAVSCSIIRRNVSEVVRIIRAARNRFSQEDYIAPVVIAGGLTEQPLLLSYLKDALKDVSGIELSILSVSPVEGALKKARNIQKEDM